MALVGWGREEDPEIAGSGLHDHAAQYPEAESVLLISKGLERDVRGRKAI